jgi:regulator of protease activity HflC (stomatin/prohibitin superfamily)
MIDPSIQRALGTSAWSLLILAIILEIAGVRLNLPSGELAAIYALLGFLGSAMIQFVLRVHQLEHEALAEYRRIQKSGAATGDQNLFQTSEENIQSRRVRRQVEKWWLPAFALVFFVIQVSLGWWMWQSSADGWEWSESARSIGLAVFGSVALIAFLFGKYMAGLARGAAERWLRFSASSLIWISVICFLTAAAIVAAWAGLPGLDKYLLKVLIAILWVNAFETAAGMVFEIYRPRREGEMARFLFESRLMSFLSHPGGFFSTAAQAIDYQFGFKVSETWFYRYLEKAIGWIILVQLGLFWLSTAVLVVEPQEQVLIERWGRSAQRSGGVLEPGLHFKFPWPVERAYRYDTRLLQRLVLGPPLDPETASARTRLWSQNNLLVDEFILVASDEESSTEGESRSGSDSGTVPVNLLSARIPMQYFIRDLRKWALEHSDPEAFLQHIAQREVSAYFISVDFNDILISGRLEAAAALKQLIQQAADNYDLGVEIVHLSLHEIQPPQSIASEFEAVIGAAQRKSTMILEAESYAARQLPLARAEASRIVNDAHARSLTLISEARGRSAAFANRLKAYMASPGVYRNRSHLQSIARGLSGVRKFLVLTTNRSSRVDINFEQQLNSDLLNLDLDSSKTPSRNTSP